MANVRRNKKSPVHVVSSTTPFKQAVQFACMQLYRTDDDKWRTKLEGIAEKLTDLALAGDMPAIKEVSQQLDGRIPTITVDNSTHITTVGAAISELMARRSRAVDAVEVTVNEGAQKAIEGACEGAVLPLPPEPA